MHEASTTKIHANMRHLALYIKEQQVADSKLVPTDRAGFGPQLSGRSWYALAGA